jgi:transposase-like protein
MGEQRFICKCCGSSFQQKYRYQSCKISDKQIIQLTREGCGIRSASRILGIAQTTMLRRILKIARSLQRPILYNLERNTRSTSCSPTSAIKGTKSALPTPSKRKQGM